MGAMADATYTTVDLSRLPAPDIIEALDFETIQADVVARMLELMPDIMMQAKGTRWSAASVWA